MALDFAKSVRRGAFALALSGAALLSAFPTAAQVFTDHECRAIVSTVTDIFNHVGADKLSLEFRQSVIRFIMPNGTSTCDGPKQIVWRTDFDRTVFTTIRSQLLAPQVNISLDQSGVKLAPTSVAALRPPAPALIEPISNTGAAPALKMD